MRADRLVRQIQGPPLKITHQRGQFSRVARIFLP